MVEIDKLTIFIIPATKREAINFLQNYDAKNFDYWIYLGRHATRCADIETIIGDAIKKKEIGEELQKAARSHRQNYINFIGNLAKSEKKPFWYLTSLSEKNPYVSNFFLNFCYIQVLITIISNNRDKICVFCESDALAKSLKKNLENSPDFKVFCQVLPFSVSDTQLLSLISLIKKKSWFVIRFLFRVLYAKIHAKIVGGIRRNNGNSFNKQPSIIIHSWADHRSFSDTGEYQDIYFGDLSKRLQLNQLNVIYLIYFLPTIWYSTAVNKMRLSSVRGCLFEEFIDFSDIYLALVRVYRQKKWISNMFILSGLDVSDLVYDEKAQDWANSRAEQSYLSYCAGKKMCQSFGIHSFIYTFENHIWEKMIIEGIRNVCPKTDIIGYAHSTVNRMDLVYSLSSVENDFAPLPNKILVNGIRAKRQLIEFGFNSNQIEIIGALRYESLKAQVRVHNSEEKNRILVVLSVNFDGSVEMILKCTEAFRNLDNIRVTFKPHPAHKISNFSWYIKYLPSSFSFSSDPIHELFKNTDLVIYTDSTASVEAATKGIPLLHIKSNFTIDINIFEDTSIVPSANSPDQIRSIAIKILNSHDFSSESIQKVIEELFAPVDEQRILSSISVERES